MLKIRFKRGTTAQNDALVLNIGALSIDEENLSVRVHDGTTPGGHSLGSLGSIDSISDRLESLGLEDVDGLVIALASKIAVTELGQVLGVAQLNPEGVIPTEQLPSYVEDVITVDGESSLPTVGEVGKLYVTRDANELYRWSGGQQQYYRITAVLESTDGLSEGQVNLYFTDTRVRDSLSALGDLTYDPATGVLGYDRSVTSVNGQEGEVTIDQADVGLSEVLNYSVASALEAAEAQVGTRFTVPARIRTFAESMGFVDTDRGWTAEPGPLPALELQGVWTRLTDGPGERAGHGAVVIDGKMYVFGGSSAGYLDDLWAYDPGTDTWTQLADGPATRTQHSAVELNGKLYVYGGLAAPSVSDRVSTSYMYDPDTDIWTQLADGPTARYNHSAVALNGKMYVFGGSSAGYLDDLWAYDPVADAWTRLKDRPTARYGHSAVALNGKMYVYGGTTNGNYRLNDLWVYDPLTDLWSQLESGPSARYSHSAVALNGKMYIYSGWNGSNRFNDLRVYGPVTDNWDQLTDGPGARTSHSAVALNGKMYVYGGYDGSNRLNDLWVVE